MVNKRFIFLFLYAFLLFFKLDGTITIDSFTGPAKAALGQSVEYTLQISNDAIPTLNVVITYDMPEIGGGPLLENFSTTQNPGWTANIDYTLKIITFTKASFDASISPATFKITAQVKTDIPACSQINNKINIQPGNLNTSVITQVFIPKEVREGAIDAIFPPFPGESIQSSVLVTSPFTIYAVGLEGTVLQYSYGTDAMGNQTTPIINLLYEPFPGIDARGVAVDSNNFVYVVGADSKVVRYKTLGEGIAKTLIDRTINFEPFPGIYANDCTIFAGIHLIVVGLNGSVVSYIIDPNLDVSQLGKIERVFPKFPGINAQAVAQDSADTFIVVGYNSSIVRYNFNGTIETVFEPFPGTAALDVNVAVFLVNKITVVGKQGKVVRYNFDGTIERIFQTFPGESAQAVIISGADINDPFYVVGLNGKVVRYLPTRPLGQEIDFIYDRFPGVSAQTIVRDPCGITPDIPPALYVGGKQGFMVRYPL